MPDDFFGMCRGCGFAVERVGWDDLCFACQEEDARLYGPDDEAYAEDAEDADA